MDAATAFVFTALLLLLALPLLLYFFLVSPLPTTPHHLHIVYHHRRCSPHLTCLICIQKGFQR